MGITQKIEGNKPTLFLNLRLQLKLAFKETKYNLFKLMLAFLLQCKCVTVLSWVTVMWSPGVMPGSSECPPLLAFLEAFLHLWVRLNIIFILKYYSKLICSTQSLKHIRYMRFCTPLVINLDLFGFLTVKNTVFVVLEPWSVKMSQCLATKSNANAKITYCIYGFEPDVLQYSRLIYIFCFRSCITERVLKRINFTIKTLFILN